ncbi:MAG: transporter [Geobacteraceae bacterium]|nr:transporter [Geobacteraceae bacterium]NTW81181.1 transporter [Geobacteraceae bacterium]
MGLCVRIPRCFAMILGLLWVCSFVTLPVSHASEKVLPEEFSLSVGVGFEFATGKYGTDRRTDFMVVPVTFSVSPIERLNVDLVIPYVYQSNGATVFGSTMPYRTQPGNVGAKIVDIARFQSGPAVPSASGSAVSNNFDPDDSQSGIGDITLTADYGLIESREYRIQPRVTLYVKFPTADRDKGLGTGEIDFGPGLAFGVWLGKWHPFLEGSYVFQGESDLYATKDYLSYRGGLGYQFNNKLYGAVLASGASSPADGSPSPFEGRIKILWNAISQSDIECYISTGFTDGSPDLGTGLAFYHRF